MHFNFFRREGEITASHPALSAIEAAAIWLSTTIVLSASSRVATSVAIEAAAITAIILWLSTTIVLSASSQVATSHLSSEKVASSQQ
ncbi:hypothetical protein MY3296_008782 [Beauveria thailandica]